ncbi:MAG: T9SS type A sorting domain-containing protein [Bacteroidales bacterium]|nr:T9SS type A sorting domain-containing protein [Bacteroidales bacterium]
MQLKITWLAIVIVMATNTFAHTMDKGIKTRPVQADELISQRIFTKRSDQLKTSYHQKVLNYWEGIYDVRHSAQKVLKHEWDYTRDDWFLANRENFVYDDFGRPVEIITDINIDGNFMKGTKVNFTWLETGETKEIMISFWNTEAEKWIPEQKEVYDFDKFGHLFLETHSQWSEFDNKWTPYFKYKADIIYMDSGKPIAIEAFYWSLFADDQWFPSVKKEYEYYKNGNVFAETISIPSGLSFEYSYREEYFYQENLEISNAMIYYYEGKAWIPQYKITNIEWYNFDLNQLKSCVFWTTENWDDWDKSDGIEWHKDFRMTYEYHPKLHSEMIYLEEFYFGWEEAWYPLYRERTIYNDYHFKTGFYVEYYWDEWILETAVVSDGEFNSNGQPVDIQIRAFDSWNGNLWENISRMIFEYETPTNTPAYNAPVTELARVFPNPAVNQINIEPQSTNSDMQVRIFSITGQLIHSQLIQAFSGQAHIDISSMPSGMYLMDITSGNDKQAIKFMKR